jgi:plasmid stability protein
MRTTLTLDDDVAAALERLRQARGSSLKALTNDVLRQGLAAMEAPKRRRRAFRTRTVSLGRCRIGTIANVAEALALVEGESFK